MRLATPASAMNGMTSWLLHAYSPGDVTPPGPSRFHAPGPTPLPGHPSRNRLAFHVWCQNSAVCLQVDLPDAPSAAVFDVEYSSRG